MGSRTGLEIITLFVVISCIDMVQGIYVYIALSDFATTIQLVC